MGVLEDKHRARVFYKYLSKVYDVINPLIWTDEMRAEAARMLDPGPDDRVLDVGCGTGYGTEVLLDRAGDVHALDQSVHQLRAAWRKLGKRGPVSFYLGDAERLPFADDAFDHVWSSGSIEYWPDPVATLTELRRVTRPGGRVLIVGPNTPSLRAFAQLADAIMLFYDEAEADRMFADAGYPAVEHRMLGPVWNRDIAIASLASVE